MTAKIIQMPMPQRLMRLQDKPFVMETGHKTEPVFTRYHIESKEKAESKGRVPLIELAVVVLLVIGIGSVVTGNFRPDGEEK